MSIFINKDTLPLIRFKLCIWLKVNTALVFIWVIYLLLSCHKNTRSLIVKHWLNRILYNSYFGFRTLFLINWEVIQLSVQGMRILAKAKCNHCYIHLELIYIHPQSHLLRKPHRAKSERTKANWRDQVRNWCIS